MEELAIGGSPEIVAFRNPVCGLLVIALLGGADG
jgi:hypothetical protein